MIRARYECMYSEKMCQLCSGGAPTLESCVDEFLVCLNVHNVSFMDKNYQIIQKINTFT